MPEDAWLVLASPIRVAAYLVLGGVGFLPYPPVVRGYGFELSARSNAPPRGNAMWDTAQTNDVHLSHDMPCPQCGHAVHSFLACGPGCPCKPVAMPGAPDPQRDLGEFRR